MTRARKGASGPETRRGKNVLRERYSVAHLDVDITSSPEDGTFFGLRVRLVPGDFTPLMLASGPVPEHMARELRVLAHRLDQIAAMRRAAQAQEALT